MMREVKIRFISFSVFQFIFVNFGNNKVVYTYAKRRQILITFLEINGGRRGLIITALLIGLWIEQHGSPHEDSLFLFARTASSNIKLITPATAQINTRKAFLCPLPSCWIIFPLPLHYLQVHLWQVEVSYIHTGLSDRTASPTGLAPTLGGLWWSWYTFDDLDRLPIYEKDAALEPSIQPKKWSLSKYQVKTSLKLCQLIV